MAATQSWLGTPAATCGVPSPALASPPGSSVAAWRSPRHALQPISSHQPRDPLRAATLARLTLAGLTQVAVTRDSRVRTRRARDAERGSGRWPGAHSRIQRAGRNRARRLYEPGRGCFHDAALELAGGSRAAAVCSDGSNSATSRRGNLLSWSVRLHQMSALDRSMRASPIWLIVDVGEWPYTEDVDWQRRSNNRSATWQHQTLWHSRSPSVWSVNRGTMSSTCSA